MSVSARTTKSSSSTSPGSRDSGPTGGQLLVEDLVDAGSFVEYGRFAIAPHPFQDADGDWWLFYARDVLEATAAGQAGRFDVFARLQHRRFPGGPLLRTPSLALGMWWHRMRDAL